MKNVFTIIIFAVSGLILFTGQKSKDQPEKWNQIPLSTKIFNPEVKASSPLPQVTDYINQVTEPRIINDPNGIFAINPNVRVLPRTNSYQSEVILVRNPLNPLIMFGSSNAFNNAGGSLFISEGVYITTNGGLNWFGSDTLKGSPISNHGGDPGPTIDKNGTLIMTHLGYVSSGMFANYSTNNGANWSSTYTIVSGSQDKNLAGTDDAPSSPYYGRSYVVWSRFTAAAPPIAVSYTTNGGVSWTAAADINVSASGHYSQGCDIRVGPNGEVYVVWAAPILGSPYYEDFAGFAKSTNGGVTWTVTNNAYDMNGIRGTFTSKAGIRVNGFPRIDVDRSGGVRNGWIYVVASEKNLAPAGTDPDVILHKSTNGGLTWSGGIRVNQDALNNGKYQWFPAVRVDESGGVNIVYYDDRNTSSDSSEIYISRSIDGGLTFTDAIVSDHRFKPKPITVGGIAGGYQGDYIGITSGNGKVWPIWMDDITGVYQAWTAPVDIGPSIIHTPLSNTEQLTGTYNVNCNITPSGSGIDPSKTKIFWSRNNPSITDSLLLINTGGNDWTAGIPANGSGATYRYYIKATDSLNRTSVSPTGAPAVLNQFIASPDTVKPVITHSPLPDQALPNWPSTVSAIVTDNLGIDSVWVNWYKNSPVSGTTFRLHNKGANNYSAAFNSLNSQVNIGDIIYYKIIAQDNSLSHNIDSTALNSFYITEQKLCEGFTSTAFPPSGWSIDFTGENYWMRSNVSSYGIGSGSAMFNFWNAVYGTEQSLISLTFANSKPGDSLSFDNAYAPYYSGTDSLIIENSTDGGNSFNILVSLWGNAGGGPLVTAPATGTEFTPTNSQWITQKFALPFGTNKIKFRAVSDYGNNLYLDSICSVNFFPKPVIVHTPLQNTEQLSGSYTISCEILPYNSGINPSKTKLYWSRNNPSITDSILMTNTGGNNWTGAIPANGSSATYRYYISATDSLNHRGNSPVNAPADLYSFDAALDSVGPDISHIPLSDMTKLYWPAVVFADVYDYNGVDSVWVEFYINNISILRYFALDSLGAGTFAGIFNSKSSDVHDWDSICYRIFAKDKSLSHNISTSELFSFHIIPQILCEGFYSGSFPPEFWNLEYSDKLYWYWDPVSSYDFGYGSAVYYNYYAPSGTEQSLVTLTFSNSQPGDSISFDNAYAPNLIGTDSLTIEYSTDEGISFNSLVNLWGNVKGGPLVTSPAIDYEFYPGYWDWITQKYPLPPGTNKLKFKAYSGGGNDLYLDSICVVNNAPKPFNIKMAYEGMYNPSTGRLNMRDTIRVFLRRVAEPDVVTDSAKAVIDSVTLIAPLYFTRAPSDTYYLQIKHRNGLVTWSRAGGVHYVQDSVYNYDFTTSVFQAYGNNMILKGTKYCFFSGDINHNGEIDGSDISPIQNAAANYISGYVITDLTGDGFVDGSDFLIADNNAASYVVMSEPPGVSPTRYPVISHNNNLTKNPADNNNGQKNSHSEQKNKINKVYQKDKDTQKAKN